MNLLKNMFLKKYLVTNVYSGAVRTKVVAVVRLIRKYNLLGKDISIRLGLLF